MSDNEVEECEIVEYPEARVFSSQTGIRCKTHDTKSSVNEVPDQCWMADSRANEIQTGGDN